MNNKIDIDYNKMIEFSKADVSLMAYYKLLLEENKRVNLVSRETIQNSFMNLVAESLIPFDSLSIKEVGQYLDIGSGGGIPAIPIILSKKIKKAYLVERIQKKAAVLKRITISLSLSPMVEIICQNLEEIKFDRKFDLITVRLVKLDSKLLSKMLSLLSDQGHIIYYSGFESSITIEGCSFVSYSYPVNPGKPDKIFTVIQKK